VTGEIRVRGAREADIPAFCEIVNPYIENTTANFRTEPQLPDDWLDEWKRFGDRYPWLVAVDGGHADGEQAGNERVVGLAYGSPWRTRRAYDWTVETTVYIRAGHQRRGIGRALYGRLLEILDAQGFHSQIGVIVLPNASSVALHEAFGFVHVGTLRDVGYKQGAWRSTGLWQRCREPAGAGESAGGAGDQPSPPLTVSAVTADIF